MCHTSLATVPEQNFQIEVPAELELGVYSNFAAVASGEHDFVIDFCQIGPRPLDEEGVMRARLVSRVRIPATFIGPLLQAISQNAFARDEQIQRVQEEEGGELS